MQPTIKSKTKKDDSPKTPGGISKALLTPIRRLGLSRNFRKNGSSPFRSPLSGTVVANESSPSPKPVRTKTEAAHALCDGEVKDREIVSENDLTPNKNTESIVATPTRSISQPRKKKSKTDRSVSDCDNTDQLKLELSLSTHKVTAVNVEGSTDVIQEFNDVSTPKKSMSRLSRNKRSFKAIEKTISSPVKKIHKVNVLVHNEILDNSKENDIICKIAEVDKLKITPKTIIERTPNDLTKECVVVIQKKIFKNELKKIENDKNTQVLFDSDSDDVPLCILNKDKSSVEVKHDTAAMSDEGDDFEEPKIKVKILEDKNTSTSGLKPTTKTKKKPNKTQLKQKVHKIDTNIQTSQGSLSFDDDDFDFDNRRTILVHKSYTKPHKAKSTGSITQKDIDDLSARIEMKKKLLMAKSINKDTEELRDLTRKWQKGCQNALAELMDLMKLKFPDKHNMDYSEILETLKIPAALVGYDSDNDCFITPTDTNILLSKLNNM